MVDVVRAYRIEPGVRGAHRRGGDHEEDPADRVPRLPARDERADDGERDHERRLSDSAGGELVREGREREARHDQQRRHGAEQNPQPAAAHDARTQTLTCAGWSDPPAAAASSPSTVSGSTASRRRAPNAATVASAS